MSVSRNADELLFQIDAQKLGHEIPEPKESEPAPEIKEAPESEVKPLESEPEPEATPETEKEEKVSESKTEETAAKAATDEYGNELPAPKTYTEEEVQRMIRDRLSRGRHAEAASPHQQIAQQAAQNFTPDPNSSEDWEVQLERFVENTIQKVTQKQQTAQQYQREQQVQAEFEAKFTSGMTRYRDFNEVVGSKPITDAMMLASRGMADPAAFLYAAAKNHGKELERIAQIADPYQQGAEIGKLEANMKKARAVTAAAKPLSKTVGDMAGKAEIRPSMDDRIRQHAKTKYAR